MQTIIQQAATYHFNTIYLTIDDYIPIDTMPAGTAKQTALANFEGQLNSFVTLAAQNNISVDAEAGASDWAVPANIWRAQDILNFVASYNQSHATKFRGVQYDIEPYLLPLYSTDPTTVLTQYVQMVEGLVNTDKSLGLPLSLDIPHFYDDVIGWEPQITIDGITAYPYTQLLRLLNQLPNDKLLIMAYRNFATGAGGTIDIAGTEVREANGTNVKVIVGQETGNVPPSYVTFYSTSKNYLASQVAVVTSTFASDPSFGGIAIDYLDPFLQLP